MSVRVQAGRIYLEGDCPVEDADVLGGALEAAPEASVDLSQCRHLHGAVVQALLVFRPEVVGIPMDDFVRVFVVPNFVSGRTHAAAPARGAVSFHQ